MRDRIHLGADVALPSADGPFPTVVLRTPYGRSATGLGRRFVDAGYAFVAVDVRGRGDSGGDFLMWESDAADGYDVVEWAAAQPWSTGRVGMIGASYDGLTQWYSAQHRPPHLVCIAPFAVGATAVEYDPGLGPGLFSLTQLYWEHLVSGRTAQNPSAVSWESIARHVPLRTLDERAGRASGRWQDYLNGDVGYGSQAFALSDEEFVALDIPALLCLGWWDNQHTLDTWQALQSSRGAQKCRLLVGAWDHAGNFFPRPVLGGYDVSASVMDVGGHVMRFLDYWLKSEANGWDDEPRVRIFRTGEMQWESLDEWPSASADVTWFLRARGGLDREPGPDREPDTYSFDPEKPLRPVGSLNAVFWADPPLDVRYLERRRDCVVYTSDPLSEPVRVSGRSRLEARVSSDRPDTDVVAWLTDVHPDGRSIRYVLAPAGVRVRSRGRLLAPGEIATFDVNLGYLHHTFLPGHRIRVTITSSYWPGTDRNLGGTQDPVDQTQPYIACNAIHHGSRLLLPVEP